MTNAITQTFSLFLQNHENVGEREWISLFNMHLQFYKSHQIRLKIIVCLTRFEINVLSYIFFWSGNF